MAKNAQQKRKEHEHLEDAAEEERQQVATQRGGPPAHLQERMKQDAGKGVSTDQADNLVPLIYLLQSNSPQCLNGHEKHIRGAQAGDIWLRSNQPGDEIVKNEEGLTFQACYFSKDWVEWRPNRGGFVTRHKERPREAVLTTVKGDDGKERQRWIMPNGNVVVETRYHVGFAIMRDGRALPYTIPLSSTGHSVSKAWMFQMNSEALPDGSKAPSFAILYVLRPKLRRVDSNTWYQYTVEKSKHAEGGWVQTEAEYLRGLALHDAFASGEKTVAEETDDLAMDDGNSGGGGEYSDEAHDDV